MRNYAQRIFIPDRRRFHEHRKQNCRVAENRTTVKSCFYYLFIRQLSPDSIDFSSAEAFVAINESTSPYNALLFPFDKMDPIPSKFLSKKNKVFSKSSFTTSPNIKFPNNCSCPFLPKRYNFLCRTGNPDSLPIIYGLKKSPQLSTSSQ